MEKTIRLGVGCSAWLGLVVLLAATIMKICNASDGHEYEESAVKLRVCRSGRRKGERRISYVLISR